MSALRQVCIAIDHFQKAEAHRLQKDAVYYQARICNSLGYVTERNKYAHEFRQLDQLYPTVQKIDVTLM